MLEYLARPAEVCYTNAVDLRTALFCIVIYMLGIVVLPWRFLHQALIGNWSWKRMNLIEALEIWLGIKSA